MKFSSAILFLAGLVLTPSCDYLDSKTGTPPPPPPDAGGGRSPGTTEAATFQTVDSQILIPKCISCHSGGTNPNLSSWASFAQDTRYVLPGDPAQSDLYLQTSSGKMPREGAPLAQSDLTLLYDWIEQGALNN